MCFCVLYVLQGTTDVDQSYAVHCELSAVRAVEDFCFPTHCSRGERRRLLQLAQRGTAYTAFFPRLGLSLLIARL